MCYSFRNMPNRSLFQPVFQLSAQESYASLVVVFRTMLLVKLSRLFTWIPRIRVVNKLIEDIKQKL